MSKAKAGGSDAGLFVRCLALGLASGMRSSLGFNAPGLRGVRQSGFTPANTGRLLSIGGELVVDKLPKTPSRAGPGAKTRLVATAIAAAGAASR